MTNSKSKFDCTCIDEESISDLKIGLLAARDSYNNIAKILLDQKLAVQAEKLQEKAKRFHMLMTEIGNIKRC